jgi:hypothetical protein
MRMWVSYRPTNVKILYWYTSKRTVEKWEGHFQVDAVQAFEAMRSPITFESEHEQEYDH